MPDTADLTREEILAALEEAAIERNGQDADDELTGDIVSPVIKSDTALELDSWSLRRGREVLAASDELPKMLNSGQGQPPELAAADFAAAAFEPDPLLAKACKNDRIHRYMQSLMETKEFQELHRETQLDEQASEVAAICFANGWVKLCDREVAGDKMKDELAALACAGGALKQAKQEVGEFNDAKEAMGLGGYGGQHGKMPKEKMAEMFKRIRGSKRLANICNLAGRYRRFAAACQRKKVKHGRDDVVGIESGDDMSRILPSELVQLCDEDTELLAMRRLIERQMMVREYRGFERKARGPIVVVVDESGSMSGEKIEQAKAMALALAWIARHQKRFCCLVGFSGGEEGTWCVIPPGKDDPDALMDWLEHFFGGGTDCDVPLVELPKRWEGLGCPRGSTDIICLTDAIVDVPDAVRESFLTWKAAEQVKLVTLVIQCREAGDMLSVSDRVHLVGSLGLDESAVEEVLSV